MHIHKGTRGLWFLCALMLATLGCTQPQQPAPPATGTPAASAPSAPATGSPAAASPKALVAKGAEFVKIPLGLDADLKVPAENPLTLDKVELGRMLYFDKRLSSDNTVSCATCHDPTKGWTDNEVVSTGIAGKKGTRNAPTVINATYLPVQFWDGRAKTLEEQALGPIANPVEMGNTHEHMIENVNRIKGYGPLFQKAFGGPATKERVAMAIASFERTVLSGNSRYDRFLAGDKTALSEQEQRGRNIFVGKGRCVLCHSGTNFTDGLFHNIGVGMDKPKPDLGRYDQTKQDKDKGSFRTPILRDISRTAPYMHDGSEKTLEAVVEYYDRGGNKNPTLDPLMIPLKLTAQEKADLVAFMKALDGDPPPAASEPKLPD